MDKIREVTPEDIEKARKRTNANTPATVIKFGRMVDSYWEEIRRAPAEGKKVAWFIASPGTILTAAAGMPTLLHAAYAPYCTARRWEVPSLEVASEYGFLPDTCSYIRVHVALAHLWRTGQIERIREELRIPLPDIVVCGRMCTEHSTLGELVARIANCKLVTLDLGPTGCRTEEDFKRFGAYLERQMKENLIPVIEEVTGRPYDYAKLSEYIATTRKIALIRDEIAELMKNRPSPLTMFDLGISVGAFIAQMGKPEMVTYYQELLTETKERVAKGIGVVPNERYRLYWDGYTTWSLLGTMMRMLGPRGGIPLVGRYIFSFYRHPEMLDPENPLGSLAQTTLRWQNSLIFPQHVEDYVMQLIRDYQLDGMILLSLVTCRMFNPGQEEFAARAEREFGIPSLIFPADMVDRSHINEAQLHTRLEAFLETIDARKRRVI